jgi:uncharacterized membrane protein
MTRDEFLRRLKRGLAGLPSATVDDIMADYAAHFEAAAEEGRPEAEVAAALGDPGRLARELKLEAGINAWHETRSPSAAWTAIVAFIGLGAIDILILLPLVIAVIGVVIGFYSAVIALFIVGAAALITGPFTAFPGGAVVAILGGLGAMAAAVGLGALLTVFAIWLLNALMWFGRLHYRLLKPALDNEGAL